MVGKQRRQVLLYRPLRREIGIGDEIESPFLLDLELAPPKFQHLRGTQSGLFGSIEKYTVIVHGMLSRKP